MRVRYMFSSRKSRRARDSPKMRKQREEYPSIAERIVKESDIILEVLDARFAEETRNKQFEEKIKKHNKKLIYILNKYDLVNKKKFNLKPSIVISCKDRTNIKKLRDKIKIISKGIQKDDKIIVGVIGYPNTGKSSLINLLIGRSSARTSADAGFTKGVQKLRLSENIQLLDTPGVIPKEEYSHTEEEKIAKNIIVGGKSHSQIKEPELAVAELIKRYPNILEEHYKIDSKKDSEFLLEKLGKKKGFLKKGGEIDIDRTARFVIKEWQEGIIKA